jgi:ankyrin repeat protein
MEEDLPEFCELVLEHVNQPGNFGNLPIHVAAVRGLPEELDALIAGGADVNAAGELGNRPLHEAIGQRNKRE